MTQHCETEKHQTKMKTASNASSNACACGKTFELRSSLYNHKKSCKATMSDASDASDTSASASTSMTMTVVEKEIAIVAKKTKDIADKNEELMDLKTMVQMLLNDRNTMYDKSHEMMMKNQDVLREVTEQNKQLIQTIQEMTPKIGSNNVVNTTTHNTQFNLNMFLNNDCKDAIKLSDFAVVV